MLRASHMSSSALMYVLHRLHEFATSRSNDSFLCLLSREVYICNIFKLTLSADFGGELGDSFHSLLNDSFHSLLNGSPKLMA